MRIINGDCLEILPKLKQVRAVFADIPDNIGMKYDSYGDNLPLRDYYQWVEKLIQRSINAADLVWISYNAIHDVEIKYMVRGMIRFLKWRADTFIWRYTFSQYRDEDCAQGYRPILRLMRNDFRMNVDAIRTLSVRQKIGDPRAAGDRVPDNVFCFSRVQGNNHERRSWIPTQHPIKLMERIILLSGEGEFVDLCAGSGASLKAGMNVNMNTTGIEISKMYCEKIASELGIAVVEGV